jgi:hypothetical protein
MEQGEWSYRPASHIQTHIPDPACATHLRWFVAMSGPWMAGREGTNRSNPTLPQKEPTPEVPGCHSKEDAETVQEFEN